MKLTPRDELFCQLAASGKSATAAYKGAGFKGRDHRKRAHEIRTKPDVVRRIDQLEAKMSAEFEWKRLDGLRWAKLVIDTPVGQLHSMHPLAQEVVTTTRTRTDSDGGTTVVETVKIKMPCKMAAFGKVMEMCGWAKPQQLDVNVTLADLVGPATLQPDYLPP